MGTDSTLGTTDSSPEAVTDAAGGGAGSGLEVADGGTGSGNEVTSGGSGGGSGTGVDSGLAALDVIERQAAVLVRNFELLYRRTDIHDGLDRAEYLLLRVLSEHGPQDINTLAASLGLDPSTAGRQVSALSQQGLVERAPAPTDRRRCIITPTAAGLSRMDGVRARRAESLADLLGGWTEAELTTLGAMFTKYNGSVARKFLTGGFGEPVAAGRRGGTAAE